MDVSANRILLVDGAHYDRLRTALNTGIDFTKLVSLLGRSGELTHLHYHRDLRDAEEAGRQYPLLSWLADHGYTLFGHPVPEDSNLRKERYGTNLVGLAVDALSTSVDRPMNFSCWLATSSSYRLSKNWCHVMSASPWFRRFRRRRLSHPNQNS